MAGQPTIEELMAIAGPPGGSSAIATNQPSIEELMKIAGPPAYADANFGQAAASGVLSGFGHLGDLADTVNNSSYNPISKAVDALTTFTGGTPEKSALGDTIRNLFQGGNKLLADASGRESLPDVTQIAPDSYAHKFGEYVPALLNPELATEGFLSKIGAKMLASTALTSAGGFGARNVAENAGFGETGQNVAEAVGALGAGFLPAAANTAASVTAKVLASPLTEEQALLQAFKSKGVDDLASLNLLKEKGLITPDTLKSSTPFSDVAKAISGDTKAGTTGMIGEKSSQIGKALEGTGIKTEDLIPSRSTLGDTGKLSEKDISSVLSNAKDNIEKKALIKLYPKEAENIDALHAEYKDLPKAQKEIIDAKINNLEWSGNDIWKLRQNYDSNINWEGELKGKAPIWAGLRDNLQNKVIDLTGGAEGEVAGHFNDLSKLFNIKDNVQKLADLEVAGRTQSNSGLLNLIQGAFSPVKKVLGLLEPGAKPADLLNQSFGNSLGQKVASGNTLPQQFLKAITPGAAGAGLIASLFGGSDKASADSLVQSLYAQGTPTPTVLPETSKRNVDGPPNFAGDQNMDKPLPKNATKQDVVARIDSNPLDKTIFEMESNRNKTVTNNESSAKGAFQLINSTANKLGVRDVFDLADNYKGFQALKNENQARFGNDPIDLYGAHFLGATIYGKYLKGQSLTDKQQELVDQWESIVRPRFVKKYAANVKLINGVTEV